MATIEDQANRFLAGEELAFDEVDALWQALKRAGELSQVAATIFSKYPVPAPAAP